MNGLGTHDATREKSVEPNVPHHMLLAKLGPINPQTATTVFPLPAIFGLRRRAIGLLLEVQDPDHRAPEIVPGATN